MSENSRQNFLNRLRIRKDLEKFTAGALSRHGDIDALVARIATLERPQQDFIYEWAELVAGSKFIQWPAYGQAEEGHIGLQDHGDPVWYRNIKVRELD